MSHEHGGHSDLPADAISLEGHGGDVNYDGWTRVSNGFTFFVFVCCGFLIPMAIRLSYCRGKSRRFLGSVLTLLACAFLLLGAAAWDTTEPARRPLAPFFFIPVAGMLLFHFFFHESRSIPSASEEPYLPLQLETLNDFIDCALLVVGFYMPLFGIYAYAGVMESPNFWGNVFGHLVPGTFVALPAQFAMHYFRNGNSLLAFQRFESLVMLCAASFALVQHTIGNHGSIFRVIWTENPNWMKDEQHFLDLTVWIAAGSVGYLLYTMRYPTGVHVLLPALTNFMAMTSHPQPTRLLTFAHWSFGGLTFIGALFRLAEKLPEYALFGALGGMAFVFSTPEVGYWADTVFAPSSYFLFEVVAVTCTWAYNVSLWNTDLVEEGTGFQYEPGEKKTKEKLWN